MFVYSIIEKKIISTLDVNSYVRSKVKIGGQDYFEFDPVGYRDSRVPVNNGYMEIYINHYGEDGRKSFYAYLNVKDVRNLKMEDHD